MLYVGTVGITIVNWWLVSSCGDRNLATIIDCAYASHVHGYYSLHLYCTEEAPYLPLLIRKSHLA